MSGDRRAAGWRARGPRDLDAALHVQDQAAVAAHADLGEPFHSAHRADHGEILAVVRAGGAERVAEPRAEAVRRPDRGFEVALAAGIHRARALDRADLRPWLEEPEDGPAAEHC